MATYDPARAGVPSIKGIGMLGKGIGMLGIPVDARSLILDDNFNERPFSSTAEAIAYFDTAIKREGKFSVFIDNGGITKEYWWRDGTGDGDLVLKITADLDIPVYIPQLGDDFFDI